MDKASKAAKFVKTVSPCKRPKASDFFINFKAILHIIIVTNAYFFPRFIIYVTCKGVEKTNRKENSIDESDFELDSDFNSASDFGLPPKVIIFPILSLNSILYCFPFLMFLFNFVYILCRFRRGE